MDGISVVSAGEAGQEPYPYIYVCEDGSARELHFKEREYLETVFAPNDSSRPSVKPTYESKNSWGELAGFCRRSQLPPGTVVADAPAEDPSPPLSPEEFVQVFRRKYEQWKARGGDESTAEDEPAPSDWHSSDDQQSLPANRTYRRWGLATLVAGVIAVTIVKGLLRNPPPPGVGNGGPRPQQPVPRQSFLPEGLREEVMAAAVRKVRTDALARVIACQQRLGISDEELNRILKRGWLSGHPGETPPWEAAEEEPDGDWRAGVLWNADMIEPFLERFAAAKRDAGPSLRGEPPQGGDTGLE